MEKRRRNNKKGKKIKNTATKNSLEENNEKIQ